MNMKRERRRVNRFNMQQCRSTALNVRKSNTKQRLIAAMSVSALPGQLLRSSEQVRCIESQIR